VEYQVTIFGGSGALLKSKGAMTERIRVMSGYGMAAFGSRAGMARPIVDVSF
jgi:hypothetical protein